MNKTQIVQTILDRLAGKTYLEIGTDYGSSFFPVQAKRKIAVDPEFKIRLRKRIKKATLKLLKLEEERFFEMTSDDFFLQRSNLFRKRKIDVALIDGLHTYQQSLQDLLNCLDYLSEKGIIVIHDCNPPSEIMAYPISSHNDFDKLKKLPGWDGRWCGDVWKTIVHLRSLRNDLNVFVLDCEGEYGVGIVTRAKPENMLNYSREEINFMSYPDLELKRAELLNLKPEDFLQEFLKKISPVYPDSGTVSPQRYAYER